MSRPCVRVVCIAIPRGVIRSLLLALGVLPVACGGTPTTTPSPEPAPNPLSDYSTTGRLFNVLEVGPGVKGTIVVDGSEPITSDANGFFALQSERSGAFRGTITAPGYFERQTGIVVPGWPADVSLIPASFHMETYTQLARTAFDVWAEGMKSDRWVVAPRLIVYTHLLDCSRGEEIVILSEEVPEEDIVGAISSMRTALDALSGGVFPDFAEIVREPGEVGERRNLRDARWDGAIHSGACKFITYWDHEVDGGGAVTRHTAPFVVSGGLVLWKSTISGLRRQQVQMHEFGHALGLGHTFTHVPSIMSYTAPTNNVSWFDRQAGRVLYLRPPANRAPDIDPPGFVVNAAAASLGFLSTTGSFVPAATWMCRLPPGR